MPATQTTQLNSKQPSGKLSALEIAVMGKNRALGSQELTKLEINAADEDWQPLILKAKQGGPKSWFASKVDFTFNSARFSGKVGYPVQGEVIPLFDGAAMDVSDAEMKAEDTKTAKADPHMGAPSAYKNWVIGSGGLLVLAPVGADNVIPVRTGNFIVTENSIFVEAAKDMEFHMGNDTVSASRMDLNKEMAVLYDIHVSREGNDKSKEYQEIAAISKEGISLFPVPKPIQEMPRRSPDAIENVGNLFQQIVGEGGDSFSVGREKTIITGEENDEEDDEDPLWKAVWDAFLEESEKQIKEAVINLLHGNPAAAAEVFKNKWDQLKKVFDGFSSEALKESWREMPDELQDIFTGKITDEEEIKNYLTRLFPQNEIMEFLGMKKDEDKKLDDEKENSGEITLAEISLLPGFANFSVILKPAYSFSAFIRGDGENLSALWNTRTDTAANLSLTAGVKGSLSIKAAAQLTVGIAYIIEGCASLYAQGGLKGSGAENIMLQAAVNFPVKRSRDGTLEQGDDLTVNLEGGLELYGTVGTEGGIKSRILMWEKKLFEKEFGSWTLASIQALLTVSKSKESAGSWFSGWSLDEASLAIGSGVDKGFGKAFVEENTADKKYGLYNPDLKESETYAEFQKDFMKALEMLEKFVNLQSKGDPLLMSNQPGEGVNQAMDMLDELRQQFVILWADGQRERTIVQENLEALEASGRYKKEEKEKADSLARADKHLDRVIRLERQAKGEESAEVVSAIYDSITGVRNKKGKQEVGYAKAMRKQATETSTSFEKIVEYERNRYLEKFNPHMKLIGLVDEWMEQNLSDEEILSKYEAVAGKEIEDHRAMFQSADAIILYEEGKIQEKNKEKRSPEAYYKKIEEMASTQASGDFFLAYAKKLSEADAMYYGTPELLVDYEGQKLAETGNLVKEFIQEVEDKTRTSKEAIEDFTNKIPNFRKFVGAELYRTATVDDLIELELEKSKPYQRLRNYLDGGGETQLAGERMTAERGKVFGKDLKAADQQIQAYIDSLGLMDLIPYMTIEMLWDYVQEKKGKVSVREFDYVKLSKIKIEELAKVKKPGEVRNAEMEVIQQYFSIFSSTKIGRNIILKNRETDVSMMANALESGVWRIQEEQDRLTLLRKMKEDNTPSYTVLQRYLAAGGDKSDISNHQKKKSRGKLLGPEDALRFYQATLVENTPMNETSSRYEIYEQLKTMLNNHAPYAKMLEVYQSMGGGKEYGKYLKEKIKTGTLTGLTTDKVLEVEGARRDRANAEVNRRNARIELVKRMEGENKSYQEILEVYEERARTDGNAMKAMVNNSQLYTTKTGFEKSLKKTPISGMDILVYERMAAEKDSEKHAIRLRGLLGLPVDSNNFLQADLPADRAVQAQRREDYLGEFKRFRNSEAVETASQEELNRLFHRSGKEMFESIIAYENERRDYYFGRFEELEKPRQRLKDMEEYLNNIDRFCGSIAMNIKEVRNNPENIWNKIQDFKNDITNLKMSAEREGQIRKECAEIGASVEQVKKEEEEPS